MDKIKTEALAQDHKDYQDAKNIKSLFFGDTYSVSYIYQHIKETPGRSQNEFVLEAIQIYREWKEITQADIEKKAEEFRERLSQTAHWDGRRLVKIVEDITHPEAEAYAYAAPFGLN